MPGAGAALEWQILMREWSDIGQSAVPMFIGSIAIGLIFVGRFAFNLVVTMTPWMVIMMIGYFVRRGWYEPTPCKCFMTEKFTVA